MLAGPMSKTFTHENDRALRQTPQAERGSETESAQAAQEAQVARAAWQAYVGSLTEDDPRRRKAQGAAAPPVAKAEDKAPEEKA